MQLVASFFDTTVIVGYFRRDADLHKRIDQVSDVYMPLVVLGELFYGAYKSANPTKMLSQVRAFLSGCILLEPSQETADLYGQIKANLATIGKPIPQNDIWIAAAAKEHSLPLATRDQHFSVVSGLVILKW
jgi:tRNA(fMet)-specific endonuclease VapC